MWKILERSAVLGAALVLRSAAFHTCSTLRIVTQHRPRVAGACLFQPRKYPSCLPQSPLGSSILPSRKVTVGGDSLIVDDDDTAMEDDPRTRRISATQFRKHVNIVRVVTLAAVGLFVWNFQTSDVLIQGVYDSLKTVRFFHHFAFEPILASLCFLCYISYYAIIDFFVPPLWKYRIQPAGPVGDTMLAWNDRLRDALSFEVPLYLGVWIPLGGIVRARKIQETTSLALVGKEVVLALIIYDTLFYFGHWILHRNSFLFQTVHSKHHRMDVVRAGDSIRHTFLDGFWDVVCAVVALNLLKANVLSRAVFNIVAIGLIVEAHSGMNLPWAAANVVPFQIMAGPASHDDHHRKGYGNYSKFFSWWDALFAIRLRKRNLVKLC